MERTNRQEQRAEVLAACGASNVHIEELLAYNENVFDQTRLKGLLSFPLEPELHVATWREYAAIAQQIGTFQALQQRLVQLQFPIQAGISQTEAYRSATRKGVLGDRIPTATGLVLQQPCQLTLSIHQSLAGAMPVLLINNRQDFVALVQALTRRNEPDPVPDSMGACIVSGLNNWDRIRQYRNQWEAANPTSCSERDWAAEFQRLVPQKALYQDRLIILSDGPYSAVPASDLGLEEAEWQRLSLIIRLEHECTHYWTYRVFGSMHNNLLDELIADYWGIVAATGRYQADWFLRFIGLESFPKYRAGGRLQNYRGQPPLSEGAFQILAALVQAAARNLERFDEQYRQELHPPGQQALLLFALTQLTLEELASEGGDWLIRSTRSAIAGNFGV